MPFTPLSRYPSTPDKPLPGTLDQWFTALIVAVNTSLTRVQSGAGDPEGVITAPQGTIWERTDGAAGTTLYAKTSGTTDPATLTNTGWVAYA